MDIVDRFIKYTQFDTESNEQSGQTPSSPGQMVLAKHIVEELKEIGLADVSVDEKGYVMATLPANCSKSIPTIGFIAHMDTSPDLTGKDVQARTVFYTGGDLVLDEEGQIIMSPSMFPELNRYKNQDLIVTNGHTLLGADDKAGVAAIVSAMDYLIKNPEIEHGTIRIGFTPDEEIGQGADHFDVKKFGADWAYTIDGGELGELEFENFNAAAAVITIKGLNVHPGSAKDKMVNASLLAMEIASWLPAGARPEQTEGYEGFYHLIDLQGSVEKAKLTYIIRDHSTKMFEKRKEMMESIVKRMNEIHPDSTILEMHDQYYNMKDQVTDKPHIIELAKEGMKAVGVEPKIKPIRGGTDGARLSYMGLPCPNIFAGGLNFHGRYEFLPIASLRKSMQTIAAMTQILAQKY